MPPSNRYKKGAGLALNKIKFFGLLAKNMGWDYIRTRSIYELQKKSGYLKHKFPGKIAYGDHLITLDEWRKSQPRFFFEHKETLTIPKKEFKELKEFYENFKEGKLPYFSGELLSVGKDYDWVTNPKTGYRFDITKHWSELNEFSAQSGDIKYVWEKSRFSYLYSLIRYDYHFGQDLAKTVFSEITSWIKANPLNYGPNYICSQEISLRLLNWTFALHYYKYSEHLTDALFKQILYSIYGQLKHVYANINFSRKTVRNNHAITETLTLYLLGMLYPFFPESKLWREKGKAWFEEEIDYQIYDDGSYLQFSMNYHRVVVQLLTWALFLAKLNKDTFSSTVYEKAEKTLTFLFSFLDEQTGWLPNYGANDGALFFKLNSKHYRDYRPQLNALNYALHQTHLFADPEIQEDVFWYGGEKAAKVNEKTLPILLRYDTGGFYGIKEKNTLTFIRCGKHKDRPAHADNLHLDIWHNGKNFLHDSGSFQYNTEPSLVEYFTGTQGHNTVMLGNNHQMLKGPRFIWFYWSQAEYAELTETDDAYLFKGAIKAFAYLGKNIIHERLVKKKKDQPVWLVEDTVQHDTALPMRQLWHVFEKYKEMIRFKTIDGNGQELQPIITQGWYSSLYGVKEPTLIIEFKTATKKIETTIKINE